ncbi:M48 family metallopeptidase [Actinoplanes flavus]|uniref:M48 family metallopeptidase n=1 Tax=Actinoplanes flavus TaxID=2820290 RepID=A0ABS3UMT6_9ACTN|nr:M48 family metallopeptidase [Actinoplanes flavus]MBO3740100.1 M48 family metallopeptidase [Actinoplanes flavus]
MSITTADVCPRCAGALTTLPEQAPWCGACEWNLDAFEPVEDAGWYTRRIIERDRRAGFRAHRELVTAELDGNSGRTAYRILLLISGLVVLGDLVLAGYGLWLVIWGDPLFPKMFGLMLAGLAWVFRPRIGSFKHFLSEETYLVERTDAPVLHRLIELIAAEIGAPVPDRLMIDYRENTGVAVVGFRRTSVLTLGLPLLVALRPQELVALIGHELGHLKHEDSTRTPRPGGNSPPGPRPPCSPATRRPGAGTSGSRRGRRSPPTWWWTRPRRPAWMPRSTGTRKRCTAR